MVTDYDWRTREIWLVNEDGLWDISVSLGILGLGLTITLNQPIWFIALAILAYFLVIMVGKEVITRPRFYYFDISPEQLAKLGKAINIGSVLLILIFVSGAISSMAFDVDISWLSWFSDYEIIILGGIISTIMVIFGYLGLGGVRFYVYAGIIFLTFQVCQIFSFPIASLLFSASILLLVSGVLLLFRFVIRYPKRITQGEMEM